MDVKLELLNGKLGGELAVDELSAVLSTHSKHGTII